MRFRSEAEADTAFRAWREAGEYFDFNGHRIFYRQAGSGRPLLLVHGFPTASWDWIQVWDELAARYHVIAPDMLGFGWSDKPPDHAYSILEQADLHETLLAHLGFGDTAILAHDYGDTVAQEMLARYEARLARGDIHLQLHAICFLNGGLFPETHHARFVQKALNSLLGPLVSRLMNRSRFERGFSAVFGPETQPTTGELSRFWELVSHDGGTRIAHLLIRYMRERREQRERWVGPLQMTRVPLRVVNGNLDPVSGSHMVARYEDLVPDPDVVNLARIGHYPQVEDPEGVLAAAGEFFSRHYPPASEA